MIVDCVNTATGIAYQDIYKTSRLAYQALKEGTDLRESLETLLVTDYVPQMIRHVQVLYQAMVKAGTHVYIKIGTSGTGGMGLNIPYTHSEEKPSRVLLSKTAMAGAHTLLLFLMARTPGGPDHQGDQAGGGHRLEADRLRSHPPWRPSGGAPRRRPGRGRGPGPGPAASARWTATKGKATGRTLESVFIDTGENGIFSLEEFSAITTGEQMEFVTPEEIADVVVQELSGRQHRPRRDQRPGQRAYGTHLPRGPDASLGAREAARPGGRRTACAAWPSRTWARRASPSCCTRPTCCGAATGPWTRCARRLSSRSLAAAGGGHREGRGASKGDRLHRDPHPVAGRAPAARAGVQDPAGGVAGGKPRDHPHPVEAWARAGWVDLREANLALWKDRFDRISAEIGGIPASDSSSRFLRDRQFWGAEGVIQPGKLVGWIFATEEKGARMK